MTRHLAATGVLLLSCGMALPSFAQDMAHEQMMRRQAAQLARGGPIVQSSFSTTIPLSDGADAAGQQIEALRSFYRMAEGSCAEVLATVAVQCEIVSLTTNVNIVEQPARGPAAARGPHLSVRGQIMMKVEFKGAARDNGESR